MHGAGVHKSSPAKPKMAEFTQLTTIEMDVDEAELSGHIGGGPSHSSELDTLDEPVWTTVGRDLKAVGRKLAHVAFPRKSKENLLRDWDLWGPLILCVFISLLLQGDTGHQGPQGPQFTQVFFITFFGACIVTLNCKLLGGTISFFQALCVLGYCLLPTGVAAVVTKILLLADQSLPLFILRLIVTMIGFGWATFAATGFLANSQPPRRKALGIYPIGLFYFVVSWLIISHSHYGH